MVPDSDDGVEDSLYIDDSDGEDFSPSDEVRGEIEVDTGTAGAGVRTTKRVRK